MFRCLSCFFSVGLANNLECIECYTVYNKGEFIGKPECFGRPDNIGPITVEATNCNAERTKLERDGEGNG